MAVDYGGHDVTVPAGADLSSDQYKFVSLSTARQAILVSATTTYAQPFGVLQNKPDASGKAASVRISGTSKLKMAGSTLESPVWVGPSTAGLGIAATTEFLPAAYAIAGTSGTTGRVWTVHLNLPLSTQLST